MKKSWTTKVLLILFFSSLQILAQEPIVIGQSYKIHSDILGEERIIDVQLPKNYSNSEFAKSNYPVVYVLDGDNNFAMYAALERYDTKFLYRPHPEMIVVGIRNTDRTRDFTPTKSFRIIGDKNIVYETSGGADHFMNFLEKELQPYINKTFRTNGFNILNGHSFGGLFTIYTLLKKPTLFDANIAIDPSLWWDNQLVYKMAKENFSKNLSQNKSLFVAMAHETETNKKDKDLHPITIREFCEKLLPNNSSENFYGYWKYYPDYDHGTVSIPAHFDALSKIFSGIELPVKEIPKNPELVKRQYDEISKKLNHKFFPEESLLYELIKYANKVYEKDGAKYLLKYALELYPSSKQLEKIKL